MKNTQYIPLIILIIFICFLQYSCKSEPEVTNDNDGIATDTTHQLSHNSQLEKTNEVEFPELLPINQIDQDPSLKKTIQQLKKIIQRKNVSGLKQYIDENIKIGFGTENGKTAFINHWNLNSTDTDDSEIWQELNRILDLGGVFFNDNSFSMPYVFDHFPANYDIFEFSAITGENVHMREEPNLKGKILASLSYEIVKLYANEDNKMEEVNGEKYPWIKIMRTNNEVGYVYGKYVRSPSDYRIFLEKQNGKWIITTFLAGD